MSLTKKIYTFLIEASNAGIIDEKTKNNLQNFADTYEGKSIFSLLNIIGFFGGLVILAGLILVISNNWTQFSSLTKISLYLVILAGLHFLAFIIQNKIPKISKIIYFIIAGFVQVGIYLITEIFKIKNDNVDFLLIWLILILPMSILLRSAMIGLLSAIIFYTWMLIKINIDFVFLNFVSGPTQNQITFYIIFFSNMILISRTFHRFNYAFDHVKFIGYFFLGFITLCMGGDYEFKLEEFLLFKMHSFVIGIFILNIVCIAINFKINFRNNGRALNLILMPEFTIALLNTIPFIISLLGNQKIIISFIYSLIWFLGCIILLYNGEIKKSKTMINIGSWCAVIGIISRFFDIFKTFFSKGWMFILFGAILIIIAYYGEKYRKNLINKISKNYVVQK